MPRSVSLAFPAVLAGLFLAASSQAVDSPNAGGHVRLRHDVFLAENGNADFARPDRGAVLPCAGQTGSGYLVVWRDAERAPRMALLPHRTEWGHASARLWVHDAAMAPNTLVVLNPVDLRRGAVPLLQGEIYPLVSSNATGVTVSFELGGYQRDVTLAASDVESVGPGDLAPATSREDVVQAALDKAEAIHKKLRAELRVSERKKERLANLLEQLEITGVENAEIAAQLKRANATYRDLARWKPQSQAEVATLQQKLGETIREQGLLMTRLKRAELDAEPLRMLHRQIQDANAELEDLRVQLASGRAEAEALKSKLPEEYTDDLKQLDDLLVAARDEHGELTKLLSHTERCHRELSTLFESLSLIGAENAMLNERIAELLEEIEGIRLAMTEAAEAADPPVAEEAPAPAERPMRRPKPGGAGNAEPEKKPIWRLVPAGEGAPNPGKRRARPPQPAAAEDAEADREPVKAPRPAMEEQDPIRPVEPAIIEPPADEVK